MFFKATCNPIRMKPVRYAMKQWRRKLFINTWRHIKEIGLNMNVNNVIYPIPGKIVYWGMKLHSEFSLPLTPKLHIIFAHLPEYFEMTGKTLRRKTDQTVETTHSKLSNQRCEFGEIRWIFVKRNQTLQQL